MKVLRSYRVLRFALVLFAILSQCVALASVSLLAVAGTLAAISWYVTEGPRGKSIPPWVSRLLVFVVIVFSLFDVIGPVAFMPLVLGRFVVWLTVIKLYGERTVENEAQLLLLSFLLMAVGSLYATDFLFGVLFLLWLLLASWIILLYQLHHGVELMRSERYKAVPIEYPAPWTRPVTGLHVRKKFRRSAMMFLLLVSASSIGFFLAIPRESMDSLAKTSIARDDGLDRMELKPDRDLILSNKKVMSVSLTDTTGKSVHLERGLRLRGTVLDVYRGNGVWETGSHNQSTLSTLSNEMSSFAMEGDGRATLMMEVKLHQPIGKIYSLYRPLGIETTPPSRITMNLANSTMRLGLGAAQLEEYRVEVDLENMIISPITQQRYQYQNTEVRALALSLLQTVSINEGELLVSTDVIQRAALAFEKYLRSNEFTYTTDGSALPLKDRIAFEQDEDPIASFLLKHKRGHCEFFASAMVAMCDTVNIPARIVTGYYADRWDDISKSYIVLERDAHAWVEIEVQPLAWIPFDPTPPSEGAPTWQQAMSFSQSIRFAWQRWEMAWQANVVSFDASAQSKMLELASPYWKQYADSNIKSVKNIYASIVRWFDIGAGGRVWIDLVMGAVMLSGLAFLIVAWRRRRTRVQLGLNSVVDEGVTVASVEYFAKLQRQLARYGWIRPSHVPTMTWVTSLPMNEESLQLSIELTKVYYNIRFGGHRLQKSQRAALMQSVHKLEELLRMDTQ